MDCVVSNTGKLPHVHGLYKVGYMETLFCDDDIMHGCNQNTVWRGCVVAGLSALLV